MSRPPIEWPIPVYITELRERVVTVFRLPARRAHRAVGEGQPREMAPEAVLAR